ncbi:dihydrofolate reductase [Syntrophobotulus glycolicus DSM 8271]|uniref:dihydrofolate reductase n=1 Tax=Syntrophobotulus glycolicus (strain DSM 8271 / FlGlyR) TaxID=645991 RepID=F0SXC6_SYNGF|nr:dihydrofolate reductase [Syntrophobotulus glycolicus]ADY54672.1 dihydrofolate reductase [Syntrophobotulus glycolicus DSM 8271]
MKALVAVDLNWGIGYRGNLLKRIPEDMKLFKRLTLGKVVIMGRATFESLPGKEALKDRINIVLSKNDDYEKANVTVCHSLQELFPEIQKYSSEDIFIIGGETIYSQLLPFCSQAYITKIQNKYAADKYFPNIDQDRSWKLVSQSDLKIYEDIQFFFTEYVKIKEGENNG